MWSVPKSEVIFFFLDLTGAPGSSICFLLLTPDPWDSCWFVAGDLLQGTRSPTNLGRVWAIDGLGLVAATGLLARAMDCIFKLWFY